jgi:hypothetical protein
MHVAVLGCGPSGLLAAHAARELGCTVTVISVKEKSPILGGQYLHVEVPGITGKADTVTYVKVGDAEGYSQKVYGKPDVPCFRFDAGEYPAWSMTEAYDNLWGCWNTLIADKMVEPEDIGFFCGRFDHVLCTLPRQRMCYKVDHRFESQGIEVFQGGSLLSDEIENLVFYSGRERDAWYRTSNLFGHETTEWSLATKGGGRKPVSDSFKEVSTGIKPLHTDCDCHDEHPNFHRLGRFGEWKHGVLVSDALEATRLLLAEEASWRS